MTNDTVSHIIYDTVSFLVDSKGGLLMPKETFMKLPQEKKDKIILAAKKEFSRVSFEETSIKNIVEDAGIARGSFYQYFESKEDLLKYLMYDNMQKADEIVKKAIKKNKRRYF